MAMRVVWVRLLQSITGEGRSAKSPGERAKRRGGLVALGAVTSSLLGSIRDQAKLVRLLVVWFHVVGVMETTVVVRML